VFLFVYMCDTLASLPLFVVTMCKCCLHSGTFSNSASKYSFIDKLYFKKLCTGCNRRNGPDFGRVFLRSYYTDITQNTYIHSSMVTEILAREVGTLTAITHLLITEYILKLAGICDFCSVNICT